MVGRNEVSRGGSLWEHRITTTDTGAPRNGPVIYWMQRSQRSRANLALTLAVEWANRRRVPVLCYVAVDPTYPHATLRAHHFFLQGLRDLAPGLERRGVALVTRAERPARGVATLAQEVGAGLVVTDESHLRYGAQQRQTAEMLLQAHSIPLWCVDNDVVVPVRALEREHYAARTIRPHLQRLWHQYLRAIPEPVAGVLPPSVESTVDVHRPDATLDRLCLDRSVPPVLFLSGGESEGTRRLTAFVQHRLAQYHRDRNNAAIGGTSGLSPYLHFGQIDPWTVALAVREADVSPDAQDALLDELLVRRELAFNFTHYNSAYDRFSGLPGWAQRTLTEHARDRRPGLPTLEELAAAQTGDELWNAGQRELLLTGTMHGWVRMYWGKRIIAWSRSPQEAFATTLYLNNRYALDGRDPVSYANIAWCFGKHDRPWPPRSIFGSIRTLTRAGAERRFDVAAYMQRIATLDDVSL